MTLTREQMLAEMGLAPIWRLRDVAAAVPATEAALAPASPPTDVAHVVASSSPVPVAPHGSLRPPGAVDAMDWPELAAAVAECKACQLCQQRKQAVLGVGDLHPDWLFVGEGPGAEEDVKGEPFVGQAGKLLDNMLAALGIARGDKVYIGNAVKCRPPGNRTPEAAEMAACRPWLERQIALLKPKVIVLLGKAAVHSVLHDDSSLASLRGRRYEYRGIPAVVTYHPAYLLRNLPEKAKAWEDLLFARRCLRERLAGGGGELPF
jgi:DNA polymerase